MVYDRCNALKDFVYAAKAVDFEELVLSCVMLGHGQRLFVVDVHSGSNFGCVLVVSTSYYLGPVLDPLEQLSLW